MNFSFPTELAQLDYGVRYETASDSGEVFALYFTELPLVTIEPYFWIPPDTKVAAEFTYADDEQVLSSAIGIEGRGGFSSGLPKKTWDLEFWTDTSGVDTRDVSFADLRYDDDWILDAVYNEPLRVNAFVAHQLWLEVHQLYYAEDEPKAKSGAGVSWCEVFRDGRYDGVYFISEQVDRKQLKLKKYDDDDKEIRGELFKTIGAGNQQATDFLNLPRRPENTQDSWSGFEIKYPDTDEVISWDGLYELVDFVVNASDEDFNAELTEQLHLGNLIDYFLFVQYTSAEDNGRKNIYYGKYDEDEPYFLAAWDLDGTFGNKWNGELADWEEDIIFSNGFYDRMLELNTAGFNDLLCNRYGELFQQGLFNPETTRAKIQAEYDYLKRNGVYEREEERWPESVKADTNHLNYTLDYLTRRADFLQLWTCDMTVPVNEVFVEAITLYPNPTDDGQLLLSEAVQQSTPWQLYTLTGQQLTEGRLGSSQNALNLGSQAAGMYLLRIGERTHRIVYR